MPRHRPDPASTDTRGGLRDDGRDDARSDPGDGVCDDACDDARSDLRDDARSDLRDAAHSDRCDAATTCAPRSPGFDAEGWVSSPCTGLCILHASSVCTGCGRTLDEITRWTAMNAAQRHAVLRAVAARLPGPA